MFAKALALLLLPALASAQYGGGGGVAATTSASSSASSTSAASAVAPTAPANTPGQINVNVAAGRQLVFNPANFTAPVGTVVTFYFPNFGINHSVTQSTFANPCTYLAANSSANTSAGFDSGLLSSATFSINITDTNPIWWFCKQVLHCSEGMVGSINAPTTGSNTFAAYQAAAIAVGSNEVTTPNDGTPVLSGVGATAVGSPVPDLTGSATGSASSSTGTSSSSSAMKVPTSIGFTLFAALLGVTMA